MKRVLTLLVGALLLGCSDHRPTALEAQLAEFNEAFRIGDIEKLSSMITPNYVHTNSSWKSFGKEKWLGYMEDRSEKLASGHLTVDHYEMDEVAITYYDASALVTGKITVQGIEAGVPYAKSFRVTNLWVLQKGQWLRAGFHDTLIQ